jgi:hypothetical protein
MVKSTVQFRLLRYEKARHFERVGRVYGRCNWGTHCRMYDEDVGVSNLLDETTERVILPISVKDTRRTKPFKFIQKYITDGTEMEVNQKPLMKNSNTEKAVERDNMPEGDISDDDLDKKNQYEASVLAAQYILKRDDSTEATKAIPGRKLYDQAKSNFPERFKKLPLTTFTQSLSRAVRDSAYEINCLGKRQGYYLLSRNVTAELQEEAQREAEKEQEKVKRREMLLYPILENWLLVQGYQAKDISNMKAGGPWGNPDILGLTLEQGLDGYDIELVTIEAKPTIESWERLFFEAVSHRRFANRSYFAFAHPAEEITKLPQDLRYYSELYGVGVLIVELTKDDFENLRSKRKMEPFDIEQTDVRELYSAPFFYVQSKHQKQFLKKLDLHELTDVIGFGNRLASD